MYTTYARARYHRSKLAVTYSEEPSSSSRIRRPADSARSNLPEPGVDAILSPPPRLISNPRPDPGPRTGLRPARIGRCLASPGSAGSETAELSKVDPAELSENGNYYPLAESNEYTQSPDHCQRRYHSVSGVSVPAQEAVSLGAGHRKRPQQSLGFPQSFLVLARRV
jgi:hypothetical protein